MYEILDNSNLKWDELVKLYKLDVYFAPQYCKIWEEYGDGKSQAIFYESSLGKVLYPFLLRKVNFRELDSDYFDISTPYGYGGPIFLEFDKQNLPCFLQTQNENNLHLYEHFGFKLVGKMKLPNSNIYSYGMLRNKKKN